MGNASASTLAVRVGDKIAALKGLAVRLGEISKYLQLVVTGKLPMNQEIIYQLQEIFNLLPDQDCDELVRSFAMETNDMMLALYLGSMLRSTVALLVLRIITLLLFPVASLFLQLLVLYL